MELAKMKEIVVGVFNTATNPQDKDEVLGAMFAGGIPFSKLNTLYQTVGVEKGFLVDPKVIKANILSVLESWPKDTKIEAYSQVEEAVKSVVDHVKGSTSFQVIRYFKDWANANDIDIPAKPSGSGTGPRIPGMGPVNEAVVAYANANEEVDFMGMYDAIRPCVKNDFNANRYTYANLATVVAIKKGITGKEAVALVKAMEKPVIDKEGE